MKKPTITLMLMLGLVAIVNLKCKKESQTSASNEVKVEKITSDKELNILAALQQQELKKGIQVFKKDFMDGHESVRVENIKSLSGNKFARIESSCLNNTDGILATFFSVAYLNGDCMTIGNYEGYLEFKMSFGSATTINNTSSLPTSISYTVGGTPHTISLTATLVSHAGVVYRFKTNKFALNDYCSISSIALTTTPVVTCPDSEDYSGDIISTIDVATTRSNECSGLAPLFVQPNISGNGTLGISGWSTICSNPTYNPCVAFPQKAEFSYRVAGTTTWTIYTMAVYQFAYSFTSLSAGNYEYQWRNIDATPSCSGPYSGIYTVHVN